MTSPSTRIVDDVLSNWMYFCEDNPAIPALWVRGEVPLFLVLGENASGKSFFRRCVCSCNEHAVKEVEEVIHLSMERRAGVNMMGAMKAFIYGDEGTRSTGENSAATVSTAIRTCRDRDHAHMLYWDEPDLGMSEGAAAGVGIAIAEFVGALPENTKGVFITTHSRALVERLVALRPHYIHLGCARAEAPPTLEAWLERPIVPISPDELAKSSRARFVAIQKVLVSTKRRKTA